MRFRHSGKLGDIVYSLAVVQRYPGSSLYIRTDAGHSLPQDVPPLLPLLRAQPYLVEAEIWTGQAFDHDFDVFRMENVMCLNLVDCHSAALGLGPGIKNDQWLFCAPTLTPEGNGIYFSRSLSTRGNPMVMEFLHQAMGREASFVGTEAEWDTFRKEIGPIRYRPTKDLLELGQVLAGARLFVGNQSCPLAIAEGLKRPVIQEVHPLTPNCIFYRPDFFPVWHPHQVSAVLLELLV